MLPFFFGRGIDASHSTNVGADTYGSIRGGVDAFGFACGVENASGSSGRGTDALVADVD